MRIVRGVDALVKYLEEINCRMCYTTIHTLMRERKIPHARPRPRVIVFNLDAIDRWIYEESEVCNFDAMRGD